MKNKGNALKYMEIVNDLLRDIFCGRYRAGEQLPTERVLVERYQVAHLTLRQAMAVLQKRGLITKKRCSSAHVAAQDVIDRELRPFGSSIGDIRVLGLHYGVRGRVNPVNWPIRLKIYQGIVEAAFYLGVQVQIQDLVPGCEAPDQIASELRNALGVIIYNEAIPADSVSRLLDAGINLVGINLPGEDLPCDTVNVDTVRGAYLATRHLLELGHRRIGFIGGLQMDPFMRRRYVGFKQAHEEFGVEVDERLLLFNTGGFPADGAESAERLLNCPEPPTAIFAATDYRAIGVLQKLEEMSIRVPLDMSVIGFDNIIESVHSVPALSTIENPLYQSGFEAVKMLYRKIREPSSAPESVVLPTHLIVRNSTSQFRPA